VTLGDKFLLTEGWDFSIAMPIEGRARVMGCRDRVSRAASRFPVQG
jgi:hypothetical protein